MAKKCVVCNKDYSDEASFCAECGAPLTEAAEPEETCETVAARSEASYAENTYESAPEPQYGYQTQFNNYQPQPQYNSYQPQPVQYAYQQPAPVQVSVSVNEEKREELYPAVSVGKYFWLNIAFLIPLVGFILSIVLSCAPRNRSLKNYAKAHLIAYIIGIVLVLVPIIVALIVAGDLDSLYYLFW